MSYNVGPAGSVVGFIRPKQQYSEVEILNLLHPQLVELEIACFVSLSYSCRPHNPEISESVPQLYQQCQSKKHLVQLPTLLKTTNR